MHARRKHIYWNASSVLEAFLYTTLLKYICKQWVGLELRSTRWISRLHQKSWKTRHCSWFKLQSHRDFYVTFSLCIWGQQKNDTVDWNSSLSLSLQAADPSASPVKKRTAHILPLMRCAQRWRGKRKWAAPGFALAGKPCNTSSSVRHVTDLPDHTVWNPDSLSVPQHS